MAEHPPEPRGRRRIEALRRRLWGAPGETGGSLPVRVGRVLLLTAWAFKTNHLPVHASGLSFYLLLSVVPFLAFVFLILRAFQVHTLLRMPLLSFVVGGNAELMAQISDFIDRAQSGMVGGVGVLITFGIGFVLLQRVKVTLNLIWQVQRPASYRYRVIEYLTVLAVAPLLLAAAFSLTAFLTSGRVRAALSLWEGFTPVYVGLGYLSGYMVLWLICYYAYSYLPDTRVRWGPAVIGALVGGTALALAQRVYVVSLFYVTRENVIYGALALLPTLMAWFYLAWLIFLFGAQLSCVVQHYHRFLERQRDVGGVEAAEPYLVVAALVALQQQFVTNGRPVPLAAVARRLRHPRPLVEEALLKLVGARLLVRLPGDRGFFVPRERLEQVTVREVLARTGLLPAFAELPPLAGRMGADPLLRLYQAANRNLHAPLAATTIAALAEAAAAQEPAPGPRVPVPGPEPEPTAQPALDALDEDQEEDDEGAPPEPVRSQGD